MLVNILFIIAVAVLGIILYKMLSPSEKTYTYSRTMTVSYRPDGTEQVNRYEESGIIFVEKNVVMIEGEKYIFKSPDRKKIQARLNYDGGVLKSISLQQKQGGEKLYYVDKIRHSGKMKQY